MTDLLQALHEGRIGLDEVVERFKARQWPRSQSPEPNSYDELSASASKDPDPYVAGSYDDVAAAYHQGQLTDDQYTTLISAIAESKRLEAESD